MAVELGVLRSSKVRVGVGVGGIGLAGGAVAWLGRRERVGGRG